MREIQNVFLPEVKNPESCVWKGENDKIIISLKHAEVSSHWTKCEDGLEWRKGIPKGIDQPGLGIKCFHFEVPSTGNYYLAGETQAPHVVHNNDIWIWLSAGFTLYRLNTGIPYFTTNGFIKAYQNRGHNITDYVLYSIDHKPHYFVSRPMFEGTTYEVCISGRSTMFKIFKLILIKCFPTSFTSCSPGRWTVLKVIQDLNKSASVCE